MKRYNLLSLFMLLGSLAIAASAIEPVDYVNVLVGTDSSHELSTGNTYPAIAMPWGMNFWTPVTGEMGDGWAYTYNAEKMRGIKQTHQPSPWINDYGQFAIMPVVGKQTVDQDERASWFSHKAETATPYYYRAYLADYDVAVELSPTERAAAFRFTFPETDEAYIVIDAMDRGSYVEVLPDKQRVMGYTTKNSGGVPSNFRNYFVLEFDKPFDFVAVADGNRLDATKMRMESDHAQGLVGFKTSRGEQVNIRAASSYISPEQAMLNLDELGDKDLEAVAADGRQRWNELLGRFEIEDDNIDNLRTFYSCLYRTLLFPHAFHEYDQNGALAHYSPYDGQIHEGYLFTGTGFWDTFRSLFPLLNLVYPSQAAKMQAGWANAYRESGFLPEWSSPGHRNCMVGNNSASVVADACIKGIGDPDDLEVLWEAVTHGANAVHQRVPSTGRLGHEYYNRLGYVPCDVGIKESAARTLEYAYDDWCIYQMGKSLGKDSAEIDCYGRRAKNYANLYDSESNLMRGRNEDGTFQSPFNPLKWGDAFTEGNSWHYTWSVFHDPQGLIDLMGSDKNFVEMLDSVFVLPPVFDESYYGSVIHEIREMQIMNMGNYAHGNQPIQHAIYLYDYAGEPWKAQYWVREVMDRLYSAAPDGYCGDEDNGQTSAWYVFSAMGFYPVNPVSGEYALGTPYFKKMRVNLENGNKIEISAKNNSKSNRYVSSMSVNGKGSTKNYVTYNQLNNGAVIDLNLTSRPNRRRGVLQTDRPYSYSNDNNLIIDNRPKAADRLFSSPVIEEIIAEYQDLLTNPKLALMFTNCFPNTLDTTVHYRTDSVDGKDDTFVYTGDIHAMWLRDSGAQVWPYVPYATKDARLQAMLRGVINRQLKLINTDPYANAFNDGPKLDGEWMDDYTEMIPEVHERKWEIDSHCYPIRLAYQYWKQTGDSSIFDDEWLKAINTTLATFADQQKRDGRGQYNFMRKTERGLDTRTNDGWGNPVRPVGLIASAFRPSDDATTYQFLVPSNFMAVSSLRKAAEILRTVNHDVSAAQRCEAMADEVEAALRQYAVHNHPKYGKIYAFEVDGFGNQLLMDDANVPSLLAMAYLGDVDVNDPIYQNTRRFVWSDDNPYFFRGRAGEGIGGPHIGYDMIWPMSIMMKAFTSTDDDEIKACIQMLMDTDAGTNFMHESFNKDDASKFTRSWFAWQNSLFGELIIKLVNEGKIGLLNSL